MFTFKDTKEEFLKNLYSKNLQDKLALALKENYCSTNLIKEIIL